VRRKDVQRETGASPLDWTRLDSRYVVKDRWLALRADTYRTPADKVVEPCYVLEYRAWVNVVALTQAGEVVLVRQFRPGIGRTILELPGGTTDPEDASPEAAIRRELLEETGYTGERFLATGCYAPNPASHTNMLHCFLATDVVRTHDPHPDDTEHLEVVLMPLDEAIDLAKRGDFVHALHIAALFFALAALGRIH
jgi:ADP-ribose pyrophosphatase